MNCPRSFKISFALPISYELIYSVLNSLLSIIYYTVAKYRVFQNIS